MYTYAKLSLWALAACTLPESPYLWAFCFFHFGGLFMDNTVRGSPWGHGSQWAGLNTAIESFWRCTFAEIWPFVCCYVWDLVCVMCSL